MRESAPQLSIAMIVRDEATHLVHFFDSVAALQAQVVVIDTGSSDDSPVLAQAHGAEVHHLEWSDDFAAARNESLRHCRGEWVLIMDPDERIAAEDIPRLLDSLREPPAAVRFVTRNYTDTLHLSEFVPCDPGDTRAHGFPGWFPSAKVRLFPRQDAAHFRGAVHELLNVDALGLPVRDSDIPIYHYPLERPAAQVERKRLLYLKLGEDKVRENPADAKAWEELAEQYIEAGRLGEGVRAYREAVELAPQEARLLAGLGAALAVAGHVDAAIQALDIAIRRDPTHVPALRNRAVIALQTDAPVEAETFLRSAHAVRPDDSETLRYLALALDEQGRSKEALAFARMAVKVHPGNALARSLESVLSRGSD